MRIEIGSIVKTNYSTGPYRVVRIIRGCTCPSFLDKLNSKGPPQKSKPHIHLIVRGMVGHDKRSTFYLNGYDENTLKSVWDDDEIILCESDKLIQTTFF